MKLEIRNPVLNFEVRDSGKGVPFCFPVNLTEVLEDVVS